MDLLDWDLMDFCFGFGEAGENLRARSAARGASLAFSIR